MLRNFKELEDKFNSHNNKSRVAIVCAHDISSLKAVKTFCDNSLIEFHLYGIESSIREISSEIKLKLDNCTIYNIDSDIECATQALRSVNNGTIDVLMKGKISTKDFLKEIVNGNTDIKSSDVLSHCSLLEIPNYHKLVGVTDGGMIPYPTFEQKVGIIENSRDLFINFGIDKPNIACLCSIEVVNPKMKETVDADKLSNYDILNCYIEGPISYDLVFSKKSAVTKGYDSPVTENVDILMVPDINTGNILVKSLQYNAGATMAGIVLGAKVPIVLTSRGASESEKKYSILLSCICK